MIFVMRKILLKKFSTVFLLTAFFSAVYPYAIFSADATAAEKDKVRILTISQGIELLLKNSRLIKVALPDNEMALQNSLAARSALLPQMNIFADKTFNQHPPAVKFGAQAVETGDRNPLTYGLDVYQTLFDFGKSLANYRAAKELTKAVTANTESIKRIATLEFIVSFFNILETEETIIVFEKEAESLTSYLSDVGHLYEQGVAVKNDLLPAKVRLADVKQRLIAARNDQELAVARLNNILALPLREKTLVQDISLQPPKLPEIEAAWETAKIQRPEIVFYSEQIKASSLTERAKAVENFPVFFADAGFAYQQNKYVTHENNGSLELGAKFKFYDGGAARAELLKERARQKQLKEEKDKLIEDIKFEIEDSFYGLKNASEKISVAKEALEQAEENVRFYRTKYNAGSATTTDVLEAITMQTKAQMNYCSDDYELKRGYAKLLYSMGMDLGLIYEKMESKNGGINE